MEAKRILEPPGPRERTIVGFIVRKLWWGDRRGGPWKVPDWLPYERVAFEGNVGARLAGRWFPAAHAKGVVVLAHPDVRYAQHWFVHTGWVDALHDQGFHVLTFDFAGYGESLGGATYYLEDVVAAARFARERAPDLPLHVVGVSMGAFAAANASPTLDFVDSLVLESPYTNFNAWYGRGPGKWAMDAMDRLFPRTSQLLQADQRLARTPVPRILVVGAARDRVTRPELARAVAEAGPAGRTTYVEYDAGHLEPFLKDPDYRLLVQRWLSGGPQGPVPRIASASSRRAASTRTHVRARRTPA